MSDLDTVGHLQKFQKPLQEFHIWLLLQSSCAIFWANSKHVTQKWTQEISASWLSSQQIQPLFMNYLNLVSSRLIGDAPLEIYQSQGKKPSLILAFENVNASFLYFQKGEKKP